MRLALYDERRSFLLFLILVLFSTIIFSLPSVSPFVLGGLSLLWGVFGLARFLFLYQRQDRKISFFLSLPSRILFGLGREQDEKKKEILNRLSRADIIFFFVTGMFYIIWVLYCSLYPVEIASFEMFHQQQDMLLGTPFLIAPIYNLMASFSFFVLIGVITFVALSFSHIYGDVRSILLSLFPFFLVGFIISIFLLPKATGTYWQIDLTLGGAGIGKGDLMDIFNSSMMRTAGSFLFRRFIEVGLLGSGLVYVLFLPAFLLMVKNLRVKKRTLLAPAIGLLTLCLLLVLDTLLIAHPLVKGVGVLGWCIVILCWGRTGYRQRYGFSR